MNVVMANNYLYLRGGSERVMFDELGWLRSHGHTVNAFGRWQVECAGMPHSDLFPPLEDFAQMNALDRLRKAPGVIYKRSSGRRFAAFCSRTLPDVVHCHNIYAGLTTSIIDTCHERAIPCVITLHDCKLGCPSYLMLNHGRPCHRCASGKFYHCLLARCHKNSLAVSLISTVEAYFNDWFGKYRRAAFLITPSLFLLDRIAKAGISREKLRCIPNAVPTEQFQPVYSDDGYFLYVGRLSEEKGIQVLLDATKGAGMCLRIVGDGPAREQLQEHADSCGLNNVTFEGYQAGRPLETLIQRAAFVVLPSLLDENAPMVVLEAMAYGKPVIASRIGGIPEQIEDRRTGLLFPPGDSDALRDALRELIAGSAMRLAMGREARRTVEERFSMRCHCAQLTALYAEAIRN